VRQWRVQKRKRAAAQLAAEHDGGLYPYGNCGLAEGCHRQSSAHSYADRAAGVTSKKQTMLSEYTESWLE
jgi:hypothetical protein